jgi:ribonuclease VapC
VIVVDTSAIIGILRRETDGAVLQAAIASAGRILISAVAVVELTAVSSRDETLFEGVRDFLNEPFVVVEPVDGEQAATAAEAYRRFGKGRHPAGLNLGDVFAYALARTRGLPLLFKGDDFSRTDIGTVCARAES